MSVYILIVFFCKLLIDGVVFDLGIFCMFKVIYYCMVFDMVE